MWQEWVFVDETNLNKNVVCYRQQSGKMNEHFVISRLNIHSAQDLFLLSCAWQSHQSTSTNTHSVVALTTIAAKLSANRFEICLYKYTICVCIKYLHVLIKLCEFKIPKSECPSPFTTRSFATLVPLQIHKPKVFSLPSAQTLRLNAAVAVESQWTQ